jgi:hypothetical protein
MRQHILIQNGALEETADNRIILRGVIGPSDLRKLQTAPYQKKTHSKSKIRRLGQAIIGGDRLPDIECGMRGQNFHSGPDNSFLLYDPIYVIDGLQRKMALTAVNSRQPEISCAIGIIINFGTTEAWERARFEKLATDRTQVAPAVILRNAAKDDKVAKMIYALTTEDRDCILYNRVTWDQHEMAGEVIRGNVLYQIIGMLHAWKIAPYSIKPHALVQHVNEIAENVGDHVMLSNTRKFFELVDHFWGFRNIQKRDGLIQCKPAFLFVMAELMAEMPVFWDGSMLDDSVKIRRLKPRLAITAKLKEWLAPNRNARQHVLIYYKRELNKNRMSEYQTRPIRSRRPVGNEAAAA